MIMFSFCKSSACAIADPDTQTVTITGGRQANSSFYGVPVYGLEGWQEDLENLNVNRIDHACTSFVSEGILVSAITKYYQKKTECQNTGVPSEWWSEYEQ